MGRTKQMSLENLYDLIEMKLGEINGRLDKIDGRLDKHEEYFASLALGQADILRRLDDKEIG